MDKKSARLRRSRRSRHKIRELEAVRLCIHRSPRHIYAQIFEPGSARVIVSASTLETSVRSEHQNGGNIEAAKAVGKSIAEKAKAAGIEKIAFDRAGFKYHGRIKALADAAREHGLQF